MISVSWRARDVPLAIGGAVAVGEVAQRLVGRILVDAEPMRGVVTDDMLVVLGANVPWVDGIVYIGREPEVPGLWMDTRLVPNVPVELLRRVQQSPFVWLSAHRIDLTAVEAFDLEHLRAWAGV